MRRATLRLWQRGIRTIERSDGRSFAVEYMAQRAIMGKMGEMTTAIQEQQHHDEGGYDGWEIGAHGACALTMSPYRRQYSDKEYKTLNSRLQRRIGTLSCKHIAWPIRLGVDSPQWTEGAAGGAGAGKCGALTMRAATTRNMRPPSSRRRWKAASGNAGTA